MTLRAQTVGKPVSAGQSLCCYRIFSTAQWSPM